MDPGLTAQIAKLPIWSGIEARAGTQRRNNRANISFSDGNGEEKLPLLEIPHQNHLVTENTTAAKELKQSSVILKSGSGSFDGFESVAVSVIVGLGITSSRGRDLLV
jgi:hypothetical protein